MANTEWIENMKKIVLQAMEAGDPCDVIPGVVTGEAPLTVQIDQKTVLFNSQLLVPKRLTDHTETMVLPEAGEVNHIPGWCSLFFRSPVTEYSTHSAKFTA